MGHKKASSTLNLYSHVVDKAVYEKTAQTLDGAFANLLKLPAVVPGWEPLLSVDSNAGNFRRD